MGLLVAFGVIYFPHWVVKLVISGLVGIASFECARMVLPKHHSSSAVWATVLSVAFSIVIQFSPNQTDWLLVSLPALVILTFTYYMFRPSALDLVLGQVSATLFTIFYVGLLMSYLGLILDLEGWPWLLLVLGATFGGDTGAYFAGRYLGKHRLAPRLSPKKTLEGLLGGFLVCIGVGFLFKYLIFKGLTLADVFWIGGITGLIGPLGDLAESMIKRSVGVKDASQLIPGHGGLLDRVDALLFTSPVVYWYASYLR